MGCLIGIGSRCPMLQCEGGVGGWPTGHDHCHRVVVPSDRSLSVVGRGGWREVNIGLVLIPALNPMGLGSSFVFDHGQFGACRNADIGMKPEVPPLEKM